MTMIEELKQIPALDGIVDIIDTINSIDDAALNDDNYNFVLNELNNNFTDDYQIQIINSINAECKRNGLSKNDVYNRINEVEKVFEYITENFETENPLKKSLLKVSLDKMTTILKQAAEEYYVQDIKIFFQLLTEGAKIPTYAHYGDAGADIYCPVDIDVPANAKGFIIPTGFKMAIPIGWEMEMRPRSGMSVKTPIRISNAPGTIDAGYRDEVGVIVDNRSNKPYHIAAGDRIAQGVIKPVYNFLGVQVDDINEIAGNRGGGFGSTGA